ncbi:MAG TPA: WxcM-like domain-containing protein [Cellvibrionaceae bacterium]
MPSDRSTQADKKQAPTTIALTPVADNRGRLLPVDFSSLPFEPRRIFLVSDVPVGHIRGGHGHHTGHQLLIAVQGEIDVVTRGSSGAEALYSLRPGTVALHLPPEYIAWQKYLSESASLLVLTSNSYDPADYFYSDLALPDSAWDRT